MDHEKCGDYNLLDSVASPKAGPACFSPKAILRQNNGSTRFFLVTLTYADKKKADTLFYAEKEFRHTIYKWLVLKKPRKVLVFITTSNTNYNNRN